MKKIMASVVVLFTVGVLLGSCAISRWDGFYEENLKKYLTLGEYRGLTITAYGTEVLEEEIDAAITARLEAITELSETDAGVGDGKTVSFDRYCLIDGVSYPELSEEAGVYVFGAEYEDAALKQLLPQMEGMKKGETKEFSVTLPAEYWSGNTEKTAVYRVTVRAVYEKQLPELDDKLAAKLMPGCSGVSEYRAAVAETLRKEKAENASYRMESEIWEKIVEGSILLDAPYDVYSEYYEQLYSSYRSLADAESQSLDAYLQSAYHMTEQELEAMLSDKALAMTKEAFVLYSIVKEENITCTEEEISAYASECAQASGGVFASGEDYLAYYGEEAVTEMLLRDKVIALALSAAKTES